MALRTALTVSTLFKLCGSAASPPNILLFVADDVGWANVGWHSETAKTPCLTNALLAGIELHRAYAFVYCSPSRTALMTGRLPYHAQQLNFPNSDTAQGAPLEFTFLSKRLQDAGYATHAVGKWHLGMASRQHLPVARGFDHALTFFEGSFDAFTKRSCVDYMCALPVNDTWPEPNSPYDLWLDDGPAYDQVADQTHADTIFARHAVDVVARHAFAERPLFLYVAPKNGHTPLQVPDRFLEPFRDLADEDRRTYAAMVYHTDEVFGNVTDAFRRRGVWNDTLVIFTSDNGGPLYSFYDERSTGHAGANNWPLKGGKCSVAEGGVRVPAFVSGGVVPRRMRGTRLDGYVHVADWLATIADLVGFDPADPSPTAPRPVDSLSMWPYLTGAASSSPRSEVPLAIGFVFNDVAGLDLNGIQMDALIVGDMKVVFGTVLQAFRTGPLYPNATSDGVGVIDDRATMELCRLGRVLPSVNRRSYSSS